MGADWRWAGWLTNNNVVADACPPGRLVLVAALTRTPPRTPHHPRPPRQAAATGSSSWMPGQGAASSEHVGAVSAHSGDSLQVY
jgi:hypothetical protein